jgi:hypothetical protein
MPRPKRSKVAPSAPAPAPRGRATRNAKQNVEVEQRDEISDVEERTVKRVRRVSSRAQRTTSLSETGTKDLDVLEGLKRRRDAAMGRLEAENTDAEGSRAHTDRVEAAVADEESSPSIEISRRERAPSVTRASILGAGHLRRRAREASILGRGRRGRSSSVEDNIGEGNTLSIAPRMENSTLAIGNFKRRARQPSILGGRQALPQASSPASNLDLDLDLDLDDSEMPVQSTPAQTGSAMKFGSFRRRVRQPSILGSAQKRTGFEIGDEGFNPEDESTPLNLKKQRDAEAEDVEPPSTNTRKRKLAELQVPRSSSVRSSETDLYGLSDTVPATASQPHDAESTPEEASPEATPEAERVSVTPEPLNDTLAPPRSSSPLSSLSSPSTPPRQSAPTRRQAARSYGTSTQDSPISSPPPLTHSPNFRSRPAAKGKAKAKKSEEKKTAVLLTAQLQNLLPRRRRRRSDFDLPSDEEDVDEDGDELSGFGIRGKSRGRTPAATKAKAKTTAKEGTNPKRTYSRRSGKENEETAHEPVHDDAVDEGDSLGPIRDGPEAHSESSQELERRLGRELKGLKRKFEVVDRWELEFEDDTGSNGSIMQDAR